MATNEQHDAHMHHSAHINTCALLVSEELGKGIQLSIIRLVDCIIEHAHAVRASDIHFDPHADKLVVRLRVDGVLTDAHIIPAGIHHEVISRLKILCGLRTDEHQTAQDGRFRSSLPQGGSIDVRVSIVPVYYGENAVLRLLSDEAEIFTLDNLGFTEANKNKIIAALKKPYGMILATGPTGSGKTTTLYTLVKMLNSKDTSILTIEDPVEYAIAGINQIQVNARTGLTFANGLRSMLRQDPNTIMVGEVRDAETAGLAVNIALTGHLVFSTLHTNDAATTLPRLLDMKVEPYLIASTVNIAIGQRLLRKLCDHCKETKKLTAAEVASLSGFVSSNLLKTGSKVCVSGSCEMCNGSGYKGRVGIHEVLTMTNAIREAVLERASATAIRDLAIAGGMTSIVEDGFLKVLAGETTVEEVLRMRYE
jgi:type II secretory ATPase GspE/PulE/Tfp pilus assembly ATPase PilB-like protein